MTASLKGTAHITSNIIVDNVYFSPDFHVNLIYVSKLTSLSKFNVSFTDGYAILYDKVMKREAGRANLVKGLYLLSHDPGCNFSGSFLGAISPEIWHNRLGHTSSSRMNYILQTLNLQYDDFKSNCDVCHLAKQKRVSFPKDASRSESDFDLIHMDVWGNFPHNTHGDKRYFLTIVDDFTRFTWVFLLALKSDCYNMFVKFYHMIHTQIALKVKTVRSDNGGEFLSTNLQSFFQLQGIVHHTSCAHTPQQNGVVERKHQHLLNVDRVLHLQPNLPLPLWGYSTLHLTITHIRSCRASSDRTVTRTT